MENFLPRSGAPKDPNPSRSESSPPQVAPHQEPLVDAPDGSSLFRIRPQPVPRGFVTRQPRGSGVRCVHVRLDVSGAYGLLDPPHVHPALPRMNWCLAEEPLALEH